LASDLLIEVLLLLGGAVAAVTLLTRLRVPSILGYLLVGLALGPYTAGPVIEARYIGIAAEFGIVFLLFTIGLNFSLPQLYALRHVVFALGTSQVVLTTAVVGFAAWLAGLSGPAAFVVGAVFAQSSTTIISKQLLEQGEEDSRHGRQALAMSVFQDVTAAPLVVIIPVLAVGAQSLAAPIAWTLAQAALAFALVVLLGRWLLRPLFREIAARRSPELFTLTVLFVSLAAAWATASLGLSMAFGAFLAGMMLGETEFRHQVESTIRPFRDVLLGLFFVTVGMLFDVRVLPGIWHWAVIGAVGLLVIKALLVMLIVRVAGGDSPTAWRTGIVLAVGGEFGFALLTIGLNHGAIAAEPAQIALTAVLLSMITAPFLLRYNGELAALVGGRGGAPREGLITPGSAAASDLHDHVVVCGYGRIGQNVARFLREDGTPFVAVDLDPARVADARLAGEPVYYGDAAELDILEALGVARARLVIVSHNNTAAALKLLHHVRALRSDLPVMVRTTDETHVEALRAAGATEVIPETVETGMMLVSHALLLLDMPVAKLVERMRNARAGRYRLLHEFFHGQDAMAGSADEASIAERLHSVRVPVGADASGRRLEEVALDGAEVRALVREGERREDPAPDTTLMAGDVLVVYGTPDAVERAEKRLARGRRSTSTSK
jgi:monovalent cation:H+ antiporter-2, CPA2 family